METYGIVHMLPVTVPSFHSWCQVHHHVTNMECLVGERLVAALCLIYVPSVRKARQNALCGLCNAASKEHKRRFCSLNNCCTKEEPRVGILG